MLMERLLQQLPSLKKLKFLGLPLLLCAATFLVDGFFTSRSNLSSITAELRAKLRDKEAFVNEQIESETFRGFLKRGRKNLFADSAAAQVINAFKEEGIYLLAYRKDSLVFWTDNTVQPFKQPKEITYGTSFAKLVNGYYLQFKYWKEGNSLIALVPIKSNYGIKNVYLQKSFDPDLELPAYIRLSEAAKDAEPLYAQSGKYLFSIAFSEEERPGIVPFIQNTFWILAIILVFFKIDEFSQKMINEGQVGEGFGLLISSIVIFRGIGLYFKIPNSLYEDWELFSPTIFASSFWLPSLGDFVIDGCLGLWFVYFVHRNNKQIPLPAVHRWFYYGASVGFIVFVYVLTDVLSSTFGSLILNSNIPFDVTNVLSFNWYSGIGFVMLGICLYLFFLLCSSFIAYFQRFDFTEEEKLYVFTIGLLFAFIYKVAVDSLDLMLVTNAIFLFAIDRFRVKNIRLFSLPATATVLVLFSIVSSVKMEGFNGQKDIESRKLLAQQLESGNDPVTEFLFSEVAAKVAADEQLIQSFIGKKQDEELLNDRLRQLYFGNYFNKYVISFSRYNLNGQGFDPKHPDIAAVQQVIDQAGIATSSTGLYQVGNAQGLQYYVAKIPVRKEYRAVGTLVVKLQSKQFESNNNYPELLLGENLNVNKGLSNYSFAYYQSGKLLNKQGDYPYTASDKVFKTGGIGFLIQEDEDYNHLIYNPDFNKHIVLSKAKANIFNRIALFSYFFGFLSIFLFFVYVVRAAYKFISRRIFTEGLSVFKKLIYESGLLFKMRIQFSIVITVVASLLVVGLITLAYITNRYNAEQYTRLNQKIKSVQVALENKNYETDKNRLRARLALDMNSFARLFNTDISVYDIEGQLLLSTQPSVFEQGLLSQKMNPVAFYNLSGLGKTAYIGNEHIGRLTYLSAYAPVTNTDGQTIAYVSLPYFTNQNEYQAEVSYFANALINVYALVFTLIGFVAFFVANAITSPLTIVQETLSKTKIGQTNHPIAWHRNDEIGSLVQEYNRMILELQNSADMLAKSERESAWREMAKQVAHEIKNPLTPLKLGLQQLERSWKDGDPQFDSKFARFSQTFMQQIDSLSQIATEFSNFAKMPQERREPVNVVNELSKVVDLFKHTEQVNIRFRSENGINAWILADADQIARSFNNLVKNAIQAIPKEREGQIDISVWADAAWLQVQISDNGSGIPEDIREKIFAPNFTTKNSGMGLGLAIIKNVIDNVGGSIRFETEIGEGTSFFVSFPLYKES